MLKSDIRRAKFFYTRIDRAGCTQSASAKRLGFSPSPDEIGEAAVDNSTISFNRNCGIGAAGAGATVRVGGATIASNVTGVIAFNRPLQSFKQNMIAGNLTDGTPLTPFPGSGGTPLQ